MRDDATGDDLSGKLIVVNATPTTAAVSQRVGAKLAALGVPYVHVALAGGAAEIETGDAHAFVAYVDGKVPAHVSRRCGTIAAGLKSLKSQGGVGGDRTRDVVADECERALRVLSQDKPTVVARDDCAACCDLRLVSLFFYFRMGNSSDIVFCSQVETTRTIAMRARVRETFRLGAKLARSESERVKLTRTTDEAIVAANDAKHEAKYARKDAADRSGRLEEAERLASDLNRQLRETRTTLELERRASAAAAERCAVLERELLAADSAVAGSIPEGGAGDFTQFHADDDENRALRESVEHLSAEVARVRSTTAAKVQALVSAKEKAEKDLDVATKKTLAAERAEREAKNASETLRGETNRLDETLEVTRASLASAELALVDERRQLARVSAELESTRDKHESESTVSQSAIAELSERFELSAGDLAEAKAKMERLADETRSLRDELASVEKEREASAVRAAESIESAEAKAADAIARFEAKEKELWARDAQLEKRARDAVRDAKAHAERVAALTDEKAALAAELTGAKAAIRRTNRVKEESTRKLRDELEETKRALLHATSRRVGRPWASDSREGVARGLATAGEDAVPTDDDVQRMEDKLEKERGKRERAEAAAASLQSALALARKQSHADHERLSGECRTLRALASALELERDSLRVTLKGRADLAADLTARAQLDAGKIAGLDARRARALKPRAQTGEGRGGQARGARRGVGARTRTRRSVTKNGRGDGESRSEGGGGGAG